jgi:glutaminyl-tRNA synthetase
VEGWDDPRMPTVRGLRRRGFTPESLRAFCERIGVGKKETVISYSMLEDSLRDDLNAKAPRVMAVIDPLKVTITNYPADKKEDLTCPFHPQDESFGERKVPFSREVYIERADFMENAPKKFFRLTEGKEVRLRYGYVIKCDEVIKDEQGEVIELKCSYDPETLGGVTPDGRKVKGIIHWVSQKTALDAEVRLYDRLFKVPNPNKAPEGGSFLDHLNENSLEIKKAKIEPWLENLKPGQHVQFERTGYFYLDPIFHREAKVVFNKAVGLRDTWAKVQGKGKK